jgi:hypothetical protein
MANIRTTDETAAELRRLTGRLVAETGQTVTLSDALSAALVVANAHLVETVAAYRKAAR